MGSLLRVIIKLKSQCWPGYSSGWGSEEKSISKLFLVVAVAGPRSLSHCVPLRRPTLTSYKPPSRPSHVTPCSVHRSAVCFLPGQIQHISLTFPSAIGQRKLFCFYRAHRLGQAHPDNLLILKSTCNIAQSQDWCLIVFTAPGLLQGVYKEQGWGEDHGRDLRILSEDKSQKKKKIFW